MADRNRIATITVDADQVARLQRAMERMPALVQQELGKAVVKLILIIEATAKKACPVDTGNLRSSITPVVESWARGFVGTNVEYAPFVEYGTRHAPAQPFLEPAFLEGKRQAPKVFEEAIERAIARFEREAS